jgi:hypothetical protein
MRALESAYNIAPSAASGFAAKLQVPTPGMEWVGGTPAAWRPRIAFEDDVSIGFRAGDGKMHYGSSNVSGYAANTYLNGSVVISHQILLEASASGNPGIVAQVLFHEKSHFERLTSVGWSYQEVEEELAYKSVLAHVDAFDLPKDWIDIQKQNLRENREAIRSGRVHAYSISKAAEARIKKEVDALEDGNRSFEAYYEALKSHVAKLRAQAENERRQSDERLRLALAEAVIRACASPGSVDQAEFDGLGHPHSRDFLVDEQGNIPEGLGENGALFMELAWTLRDGKRIDAAHVALRCATAVPIPLNPQKPGPPRVNPIPEVPKATVPFASMLPSVKRLAVSACQDQASVSTRFFLPRLNISFSISDDQAIGNYLAWLGECERGVFNDIVAQIRSGQGRMIDDQWVRQRGAAHYVAPPSAGPGVSPPTGPDHEEVWRRLKPIVPRR